MRWLITRGRVPYLVALGLLTAWLAWHAAHIGVERNNESLNAQEPSEVAIYERFRATFGSDEDLLLAVAHPRLLSTEGLMLVDALTRHIAEIDGVRRVYSLTNAKQLVEGVDGVAEASLIPRPLDTAGVTDTASASLDRNPDFTGLLVSRDRRTAGLLVELEDRPNDHAYRGRIIEALRALIAEQQRDGIGLHLTGITVQKNDVSEYIQRDQRLLMPLAIVILASMLALFFRRTLGVLLPLAVTGVSVVWTLGFCRLAGFEVNAITALLPPVIMVLSLAVSVHIVQGWLEEVTIADRTERIVTVVRSLLFPCFFCSLTTALSFSSLAISNMPAVRQFGLFAAVGVAVAFVAGMTLVPVGLSFLAPPMRRQEAVQHRLIRRVLNWCAVQACERPRLVLAVFGGITALALAGLPFVRNNTDLVRFLDSEAPLHRDTLFIDEHLTGTGTIELVLARKDGAAFTSLSDVQRAAEFEQAVLKKPDVTTVTSVLAVLRQLQRAESGTGELALPDNERDTAYAFDLLEAAPDQGLLRKMIAPDFTQARISVRLRAIGTAAAAPLVANILAEGGTIFGDAYTLTPTGAFYHVIHDSNRLVVAQVQSFALAITLVFLAIGVLFRSVWLTFMAMVPNVIPIVWTGGLMGAFGIDLSTGTAMIACAVLGLVVDDTIHFLTRFYRVYQGDAVAAVHDTTSQIGEPLAMNNLILVLGFWIGCFGSFKPTIYFSLLSGVTMITALVCDLLITPACLVLAHRRAGAPGKLRLESAGVETRKRETTVCGPSL